MEPRLTFLGRSAQRWRVRVELPECGRLRGVTVGLWGPDGRPLAPGVVLPVVRGAGPSLLEAELGGPAELPAGSEVRCLVDVEGEPHPLVTCLGVDRRRGLAAWLHADARLHVQAGAPAAAPLVPREVCALALAWPGVFGEGEPTGPTGPASPRTACGPETEPVHVTQRESDPIEPDDLLSVLRDEFGVDVDDLDEGLRDVLTEEGGPR
jgi:hypothetical protein